MSPGKSFRYIAREILLWCGGVFERCSRSFSCRLHNHPPRRSRPGATLVVLFEMALLKQPYMAQQIMPFVVLFGTMMAFWAADARERAGGGAAAGVSAPPRCRRCYVFNPIRVGEAASYERLDDRILRENETSSAHWPNRPVGRARRGHQSTPTATSTMAQTLRGATCVLATTIARQAHRRGRGVATGAGGWRAGPVWRPKAPESFARIDDHARESRIAAQPCRCRVLVARKMARRGFISTRCWRGRCCRRWC